MSFCFYQLTLQGGVNREKKKQTMKIVPRQEQLMDAGGRQTINSPETLYYPTVKIHSDEMLKKQKQKQTT